MIEEKRKELFQMYQKWEAEFKETCPRLRKKEYSYPYYLHIPDNWFDCKYRVIIVGEEGFAEKQFDLPIEEIQQWNRDYLASQLGRGNQDKKSSSPFWIRVRKISDLRDDAELSITWTNLDKIHYSRNGDCALCAEDSRDLHATPTKILSEEISILKPTHVIYFGWYRWPLKEELPEVFGILYPGGLEDDSQWRESKYKDILLNNIHHIFTYHPRWGQCQKNFKDGKSYEEVVLEEIRHEMK